MPPPLEAARSRNTLEVANAQQQEQEPEERNEVADAMMQRALAAREQKKKETEEARRKADGFGGGLKKGFLSSKASRACLLDPTFASVSGFFPCSGLSL